MDNYFKKFEHVAPPEPVPHSSVREMLFQFFATVTVVVGAWYIVWRWGWSLNMDALWFSIPVIVAETAAYIGLVLFFYNIWSCRDTPRQDPPHLVNECVKGDFGIDRPLAVDIFFPTYDEDPELVRLSILDAKSCEYPHEIDIRIHVLDDGKRDEMSAVAQQEGVNYVTRSSNEGFKAGNLKNAMEVTSGDFIVICLSTRWDIFATPMLRGCRHLSGFLISLRARPSTKSSAMFLAPLVAQSARDCSGLPEKS